LVESAPVLRCDDKVRAHCVGLPGDFAPHISAEGKQRDKGCHADGDAKQCEYKSAFSSQEVS
jgi:hypothetical protein